MTRHNTLTEGKKACVPNHSPVSPTREARQSVTQDRGTRSVVVPALRASSSYAACL